MKEKWTQDLQKKMTDYEVPTIPDGLWEEIDSALHTNTQHLTPNTQHPSTTTQYWRKACAAILLLLLIPTALIFLYKSNTEEQGKALVEASSPIAPTPQPISTPAPKAPIAQAKHTKRTSAPILPSSAPQEEAPASTTNEEQAEQAPTLPSAQTPTAKSAQAPTPTLASTSAEASQPSPDPIFNKESNDAHLYLAMTASGINLSSATMRSPGNIQYKNGIDSQPKYDNGIDSQPKYDNGIDEHPKYNANAATSPSTYHEEKHHRPITIGLQVGIPVADKWSLATGLAYTYLHSEITDNETTTDQRLHFMGVPVQINYQLYSNRYCNIYLGTGGRADFGVSGKTNDDNHLSHLPVNFSLKASTGVQVKLFKSLNIYAEPSLQYNIPGSTRYKTYFTAHKTMFDLQLGIRLTP